MTTYYVLFIECSLEVYQEEDGNQMYQYAALTDSEFTNPSPSVKKGKVEGFQTVIGKHHR